VPLLSGGRSSTGHLAVRHEPSADGCGQAAATRARWLWLPAEDGTVAAVDPLDVLADFPSADLPLTAAQF
jgi:hypothetical protein